MSFNNIFTHGNLVDINISMWTGQRNLQAEDLGLDKDQVSDVFSLGKKKLIPKEVISSFKHFDYKARMTLEKYSFPFEFGSARFVPKKVFVKFAEEMDRITAEFNKAADELKANYNRYRVEMRKEYTAAAHEAYHVNLSLHKKSKVTEKEFIEQFLQRVEDYYPSENEIRSKFSMEYIVFRVELPDISRASYQDLVEEGGKVRLLEDTYKKSLEKKMVEFVDKVIYSMRGKAYTALIHVARNVRSGKAITTATLNKLRTMIHDYHQMDIVGDERFRKLLSDFKARFLDRYDATQVKNDAKIRDTLYHDLRGLAEVARDKKAIRALADSYRKKISL